MQSSGSWRHPPRAHSSDRPPTLSIMITIALCFALVAGIGAAIVSYGIAEIENININHEALK